LAKIKFVDMEKCIGCELCEKVCEFLNTKPRAKIYATKDGVLVPITCLHCTNPVCVDVCPTGAMFKEEDGPVHVKRNRCIGCKLCIMACPFGVPDVDLTKGYMIKCDLCLDRSKEELPPACVELCPSGAILYGDLDKIIEESKSSTMKMLRDKRIIQKTKEKKSEN